MGKKILILGTIIVFLTTPLMGSVYAYGSIEDDIKGDQQIESDFPDDVDTAIWVNIIQPMKKFLYLKGFPLPIAPRNPIVIGNITVVASAASIAEIEKIDFYVDAKLMYTENDPVTWLYVPWEWNKASFFVHVLTVVAYDKNGNIDSDRITVWKFF